MDERLKASTEKLAGDFGLTVARLEQVLEQSHSGTARSLLERLNAGTFGEADLDKLWRLLRISGYDETTGGVTRVYL